MFPQYYNEHVPYICTILGEATRSRKKDLRTDLVTFFRLPCLPSQYENMDIAGIKLDNIFGFMRDKLFIIFSRPYKQVTIELRPHITNIWCTRAPVSSASCICNVSLFIFFLFVAVVVFVLSQTVWPGLVWSGETDLVRSFVPLAY